MFARNAGVGPQNKQPSPSRADERLKTLKDRYLKTLSSKSYTCVAYEVLQDVSQSFECTV